MRTSTILLSAGEPKRPADSTASIFKRFSKTVVSGAAALLGAMALCVGGGTAYAASLEQPGEGVGIPLGMPFPEGVYFENTLSGGGWRGIDDHLAGLTVEIPFGLWSTPWTFFNGRIEVAIAAPSVIGTVPEALAPGASFAGRSYLDMYNPTIFVGMAWDLGDGLGISAWQGVWFPVNNELRLFGNDTWVSSQKLFVTYAPKGTGWSFTGNVTFAQTGNTLVPTVYNPTGYSPFGAKVLPDYLNYELALTKTIGKWELGIWAFGSADMSNALTNIATGRQSQFAIGPMVGYEFTGITTQFWVTRDVFTEGYFNTDGSRSYETRVWGRAIIPLWTAPVEMPLK